MATEQVKKEQDTLHELVSLGGRAELLLSHTLQAARQRRPTRFMAAEQVKKEQGTSHEPTASPGRDTFQCVPGLVRQAGDAVERVPTRFVATVRDIGVAAATHDHQALVARA
jgi:hypothetical protein